MHVDLIEDFAGFTALRPDWEAACDADPEAHFFLSWEWTAQALRHLRTGWRVLAVRDGPVGPRVAFLAVHVDTYRSRSQQAWCNRLRLATRALWADFTGVLCAPGYESRALPALAAALQCLPWAQFELPNLLASPARLSLFLEAFDPRAYRYEERPRGPNADGIDNDTCPLVQLPGSFEDYLSGVLSANTRQKMRRALRRLQNDPAIAITEADASTVRRDVDLLLGFWETSWAERKGEDIGQRVRQFRSVLRRAHEGGFLYLPVLWHEGRAVGALAHFVDRRRGVMLFKVAGRDERCTEVAPGFLLHAHSIRESIARGMRVYDFLRGDEPYKYSYGATDRRLRNVVLRTRSRRNPQDRLDPLAAPPRAGG